MTSDVFVIKIQYASYIAERCFDSMAISFSSENYPMSIEYTKAQKVKDYFHQKMFKHYLHCDEKHCCINIQHKFVQYYF